VTEKDKTLTSKQLARRLLFSGLWLAAAVICFHWARGTHSGFIEVLAGFGLFVNLFRFWLDVYDWKQPGLSIDHLEEWVKRKAGQ